MRHIPEAGAVCGNSARTDLCGGQRATSVSTATVARFKLNSLIMINGDKNILNSINM